MNISDKYLLNGCEIVDLSIGGGGYGYLIYKLTIAEENGNRDLEVEYYYSPDSKEFSEEDYHEMIVIDKKNAYRKLKQQKYLESICGLSIGMNKKQVVNVHGQPSNIKVHNEKYNSYIFEYEEEGLFVDFYGDMVRSISIIPESNIKFDKSRLSSKDSIETYKKIYKPKKVLSVVTESIYIGNGEYINFSDRQHKGFFTISLF